MRLKLHNNLCFTEIPLWNTHFPNWFSASHPETLSLTSTDPGHLVVRSPNAAGRWHSSSTKINYSKAGPWFTLCSHCYFQYLIYELKEVFEHLESDASLRKCYQKGADEIQLLSCQDKFHSWQTRIIHRTLCTCTVSMEFVQENRSISPRNIGGHILSTLNLVYNQLTFICQICTE